MAKIMFVVKDVLLFERFGIMHISSILKTHGHEVDILKTSVDDVQKKIQLFKPDVFAYSISTGSHQYYIELNKRIKATNNAISIFGGPHATFFPELINEEGVDIVCVGEGEFPMLELADAVDKKDHDKIAAIKNFIVKTEGGIKKNELRELVADLDTLPFPDRELVYKNNEKLRDMKIKTFFAGRGCPYQCTYCFNHKYNAMFKGKIIRKRTVDNLIEEILQVKNRCPMEIVKFMDDIFIQRGTEWLVEFSAKYKNKVGLPFVCMVRADLVDDKNVKLLKEAGCRSVYMAIEAGNDHTRNILLKRHLTKDKMINAASILHSHGIKIAAENILGLPSETIDNMLETLELNIKCNPLIYKAPVRRIPKLGRYPT